MRERFGARDTRSLMLLFTHRRRLIADCSQPELMWYGHDSGAGCGAGRHAVVHTNAMDEALRYQMNRLSSGPPHTAVIANESGGWRILLIRCRSYVIEQLTDEIGPGQRISGEDRGDGGMLRAIELGYVQRESRNRLSLSKSHRNSGCNRGSVIATR